MFAGYTRKILEELWACMEAGQRRDYADVCSLVEKAPRIFVGGAGRTGYVMQCFSMRLAQAGFEAYWIGDNNTPSAGKGDLLILGSGSGETGRLKGYAKKAGEIGMKLAVFTAGEKSFVAEKADVTVLLKAFSKYEETEKKNSIQPMGALFEEALFLSAEAVILELMERNGISEAFMQDRHANLE